MYSDDSFAWVYDRHLGAPFARAASRAMASLLTGELRAGASLLDLCCGTGLFVREWSARGFRVTGLDSSAEMLRIAKRNAPECDLVRADARRFSFAKPFEGCASTAASMNHMPSLDDLTAVFGCVHDALGPGGLFVFDMNMEDVFLGRWKGSFGVVEEDNVMVARPEYDAREKQARVATTSFRLEEGGSWTRSDWVVNQWCYSKAEVVSALKRAGFRSIRDHDSRKFGMAQGGLTFFACTT